MKNKENCTIEIIEDNIIDEDDKGIEIIDDPKKWSQKKKLIILILLCFLNMIGPLANSVLYPALLNILADLRIDNETYVNALIGIFMIFWGPIFWASYSDMRSTRRNVFLVALLLLLISSIICAISNRIELLLAMRALQACGSSVAQSVGAGCISDLYIPSEKSASSTKISFNPFVAFKLLKSKNANVVYNRLTKKNNNVSYPELRIHSGWAVSLSTQLILNPQETYLVDAYPESSASIVALNKLFAFISAGIMSVLILPMANALGKEWRENYQIS
ncbi:13747_t:CDS:2 [Entrophospora sp. SA101]|nr:13747_t:CDS:2 [Entrophospora sp. SA101]